MSLPKGYKRLEYIQSSGTQYVDTLFAPNQNTRVVCDVVFAVTTTAYWLFGSRTANTSKTYNFLTWERKYRSDYNTSANEQISTIPSGRFVVDKNGNVTSFDGAVVSTATVGTFQGTYNLFLFANNNAGTVQGQCTAKLYSCQIYDNGTLVRDFIPCQNASGAVGLWDAVNEEFYGNAGTGAFTAGPVVPEIVDESEITELEYIQSSGTQYADTGVYPGSGIAVSIELKPEASYVSEYSILGASWSINGFFLMFYNSMIRFHSKGVSVDVSGLDILSKHTIVCRQNGITVDGTPYSLAGTGSDDNYPIRLFSVYNEAGYNVAASKRGHFSLYACQIYDNGLFVRDYIPAKLTNGDVGLYDRVFHEFYRNAGTGEFIAGPVKITAPKTPANFRVESTEGERVTLAWNASETALGYRLYRAGALLTDTTETTATVTVEPFAGAVFTLTAYNENGEGAGAELTYFNAPDNPILFLVTDRTQQDVTERNQKGYYAASDLNRVGFAVKYLAGRLKDSGVSVTVSPVLTWTDEKWATPADMTAYLKDVQTMRNALKVAEATPAAPEDMAKLTYSEANDIEAILVALDVHITRMLSIVDTGWASGLAYTGFYAKEAY